MKRAAVRNEQTPAQGRFRFAQEFVRQHQIEKIGAAIAGESLEFSAIAQLVLQRGQLADYPAIAAVFDGREVPVVPFRKKRLSCA